MRGRQHSKLRASRAAHARKPMTTFAHWRRLCVSGVPLRKKVAGVAMGLLLDETGGGGEPIILTDILGSEDALGTMDFKARARAKTYD
eukprot:6177562-Pleurochrysis_carterae.AAC.2